MKPGAISMSRAKESIYHVYFYAYSALCFFLINTFSTIGYDGSIARFCETPRGEADGFLIFIIVPLSIPFLLVKRSIPKIITYLIILIYHSDSFYTRISMCPIM
ncbi:MULTISPECIES: DUF2645 family protein [Pectobacterium]|nr:DUF2645 family protein [Pectobacterium carotovorum]